MNFGRLPSGLTQDDPPVMKDINVTPFVDVMLVLLVIFIITAPLLGAALRVQLPNTTAAQANRGGDFINLGLNAQGQVFLNQKAIEPETLVRVLTKTAQNQPEAEVRLYADQAVPYAKVVALLGHAQKAGLHRIGFVAQPTETLTNPTP
jgi:biopolymer transport protein TolR